MLDIKKKKVATILFSDKSYGFMISSIMKMNSSYIFNSMGIDKDVSKRTVQGKKHSHYPLPVDPHTCPPLLASTKSINRS